MDTEKLVIGYGGGLAAFEPGSVPGAGVFSFIKKYFWTYQPEGIDFSTRSGYFLFQGLKRLKEKYPDAATLTRVDLWGTIDPGNARQVKELGVSSLVNIEGYVSRNESVSRLMKCDVLFLPLENSTDGMRTLFIPGKLFEYLKTGKPILALAGESDAKDILERSGLAVVCDPFQPEAIADALNRLVLQKNQLAELYKPNKEYIESNFDFKNITRKLSGIFDDVLGSKV